MISSKFLLQNVELNRLILVFMKENGNVVLEFYYSVSNRQGGAARRSSQKSALQSVHRDSPC